MKNMNSGLGRGLGSLIPQKIKKEEATVGGEAVVNLTTEDEKGRVLQITPGSINVNPMQPRQRFTDNHMDELVESIRKHGIIQPLIVTQAKGVEGYELIAGERRLRASKILNLEKVPAILRDADSQQKLEVALIENLQRENLNPIETALAYRKLIDEFNLSQEEVGKQVGRSRPSITNTLRTLNLPEEIQLALIEGKIYEGHAKLLVGLEGETKQMALYRKIIHGGLSVNDTIDEARRMGGTKQAKVKINYADKDKEFVFREFFGAKAEIKRKRTGGQIIIDFFDDDELGEIINKIK